MLVKNQRLNIRLRLAARALNRAVNMTNQADTAVVDNETGNLNGKG